MSKLNWDKLNRQKRLERADGKVGAEDVESFDPPMSKGLCAQDQERMDALFARFKK